MRSMIVLAPRQIVGFVPQEDIMCRNLTVEQNLYYSAMTRLPVSWSDKRKSSFCDSVIAMLGLDDLRHIKIGDEKERGISGGQRKRVNIALEMVADPTGESIHPPTSPSVSVSSAEPHLRQR